MLKAILLSMSLTLSACAQLPPRPEIEQDGYSIRFNKFRACNIITQECRDISRNDSSMEGAQCLSAPDYKKSEAWVQSVIDIANQHCH